MDLPEKSDPSLHGIYRCKQTELEEWVTSDWVLFRESRRYPGTGLRERL